MVGLENSIRIKRKKIRTLNMNLNNNSDSLLYVFIQALYGLHWWVCKLESGISFPATLD
jgi:hypothetical protein